MTLIPKHSFNVLACAACVVYLLSTAIADEQTHGGVSSLRAPVLMSLSDTPVGYNIHDDSECKHTQVDYPNYVSHEPGQPAKPRRERPGDINVKDCPSERYCLQNSVRAGNPQQVAWWARCSMNENYSAWFVGGGTSWILPGKTRPKMSQEGTWGADYDGLFRPRRVWLGWSNERTQGGLGAYKTDREQGIFENILEH